MKKRDALIFMLIFFMFPLVSAEIKIEKESISDTIIPEINNAAVYKFILTNLGESDSFHIYSLVGANFNIPDGINLESGESQSKIANITLNKDRLDIPGVFNFVYKIAGNKTGIKEDTMALKVMPLDKSMEINSYNLHIDSEKAIIYVKNLGGYNFKSIKTNFKSAFFDFDRTFSLDKYDKKEFEIPINKDEMKKLVAGDYIITAKIEVLGISKNIENSFKFTEKAEITTKEYSSGIITRKKVVEKINEGNLPFVVQINIKKNALTRLFTNFNIEPSSVERKGFFIDYKFQKEIKPAETLSVRATTSWIYPLILLLAIGIIAYLVHAMSSSNLLLKKKVSFVRTKGGEFALKISLIVKAKSFAEKINLIDKLPALTKLHESFSIHPDKIDEKNRRIEWNINELQKGEERVFSYIIYSKVAPFGKFELPLAKAFFEKEGKVHEVESNKVFFMSSERADV